jgi:hypothetical protein
MPVFDHRIHHNITRVTRLLTEPLRDLPTAQAHLARLGAFMWLTLALLLAVIGLLAGWQGIVAGNAFYISMASLIFAYALSRIGHPRLSAWLMIAITMINLGMAAAPHGALINPHPLYYLAMPIAIAAIFLNLTAVLGVLFCALLGSVRDLLERTDEPSAILERIAVFLPERPDVCHDGGRLASPADFSDALPADRGERATPARPDRSHACDGGCD